MKITVFIGGISGGGAERVACNLANYLSDSGNDVCILTMSETKNAYGLLENVRRHTLLKESERSNKVKENWKRYIRLKKYIKANDSDTYIVFLPITICLLLHFSRLIKGTIVASERNDPKQYSNIQQRLLRHYAPRADKWVFQTEDAMQWYKGIIKNATIIPNAINADFIYNKTTETSREKIIIAAGRLNKQKNYKLLIDTFDAVYQKHQDYSLKIFGKGPLEQELNEYVQEKKCRENIEFCGYVDNMPEQLGKAQIYVLSSNYEGMPNALMEAMAMGLPCVSTDCPCGGPRYLIHDHENGILVPVNDINKMTQAIEELISDKQLRMKLGNNAVKIKERLAPAIIYEEWNSFIVK